jgi:hypothetical protein
VLGGAERGFDRASIAEVPLIDRIVRRDVVNVRRARLLRGRGIGHRRQDVIVDHDFFGSVARLRECLCDHDRERIADMADLAVRQRRMRRHFHRRAVFGVDHPAADQIADLVGGKFGAGEDREHARRLGCRRDVDRLDRGVGVRGSEKISVGLAGPVDVIGVMTGPGDEAAVFFAAHRGANPGRAHGFRPPGNRRLRIAYSAALLVAPPPRIARAPAAIALTML